jgi:hypothetical protein
MNNDPTNDPLIVEDQNVDQTGVEIEAGNCFTNLICRRSVQV